MWYPFGSFDAFMSSILESDPDIAYLVLLLPYSVTKLLDVSGFSVSFGGNVFAEICAFMLGTSTRLRPIHDTHVFFRPRQCGPFIQHFPGVGACV